MMMDRFSFVPVRMAIVLNLILSLTATVLLADIPNPKHDSALRRVEKRCSHLDADRGQQLRELAARMKADGATRNAAKKACRELSDEWRTGFKTCASALVAAQYIPERRLSARDRFTENEKWRDPKAPGGDSYATARRRFALRPAYFPGDQARTQHRRCVCSPSVSGCPPISGGIQSRDASPMGFGASNGSRQSQWPNSVS